MQPILRLGSVKDVRHFEAHLRSLRLSMPCDREPIQGNESPLRQPLVKGRIRIGNRIAIQPMEGWDGTADGTPDVQIRISSWLLLTPKEVWLECAPP